MAGGEHASLVDVDETEDAVATAVVVGSAHGGE